MTRLRRTSARLETPVKVVGGPRTVGVIQLPSDTSDPGIEFAYPKMAIRVGRRSLLRAGLVIETEGGFHLLADHSASQDYKTFYMLGCDRQVTWTRPVPAIDPISLLPTSGSTPTDLGLIWVIWERNRREYADLPIRFNQETTLSATGADVQIGDMLDGRKVTRVNMSLGIRVLELQA